MRSIERLLGSAKDFPVEITLTTGAKYVIDHPDYGTIQPKTGDLIIFPDEGDFTLAINQAHIVQIRPLRQGAKAKTEDVQS